MKVFNIANNNYEDISVEKYLANRRLYVDLSGETKKTAGLYYRTKDNKSYLLIMYPGLKSWEDVAKAAEVLNRTKPNEFFKIKLDWSNIYYFYVDEQEEF